MPWSMACWSFYLSFGIFLNDLDFYVLALCSLEDVYAIETRLSIPETRDRLVHKSHDLQVNSQVSLKQFHFRNQDL